jgi:uncharacterized protein
LRTYFYANGGMEGMQKKWIKRTVYTGFIFAMSAGLIACSTQTSSQEGAQSASSGANSNSNEQAAAISIDKANKDALKATLAGGSVGGFWSGMGQVISKSFADSYPGSAATYEPGSGAGNIKLIDEEQVELAIVQNVEAVAAKNGIPPFAKKYENMMAIGTLYDNALMQVAVRKDFADKYGVKSLADIAAKKVPVRIGINQKGNLNSLAAMTALETNGITEKDLKTWGGSLTWAGSSQRWEAVSNNRMDISVDFVFAPDSKIQEAAVQTQLQIWSVDQKTIDTLKKEWELSAMTMPKSAYQFQQEDVQTVGISAILLASKKVSPTDQYKMAKSLVDNLKTIQALHPAMKDQSPQKLSNTGSIPLAPGAKELYEEVGAIKK